MIEKIDNKKLGRGLSSLLGDKKFSIIEGGKNELNIDSIVINNNQPRKNFNDESLNELVESVKQYGILQPILVRKIENNKYEIIAGERRYRSAKLAGLKTIPVLIKELDDEKSFNLSIIENIQRENLNPLEEANAYNELIKKYNYTQQDIANKVGKSRSYIANLLRLLNLPDVVQKYLIDGKLEMGHARALVNCNFINDIIDYIVDNNLSVREVEKLVNDEQNIENIKNKKIKKIITNNCGDRIDLLKKAGYNCKITCNKTTGKSSLNLQFNSIDELDDFINNLIK
ncbi:MAG: ParB/RepB/Spo0J family partition protein [Rickettsiales bacterium]|nr:ParB/RepB/Spo0J family partition protein [Rickettsiales bacterium]